jgi:hypothetical protein
MKQLMKCGDCGVVLEPRLRDSTLFIDHRCNEAEGKDLIAYAARYSWLREERDEQQPVVTIATFSDWGQPWRDVPLWGDELDAAVDKAMASSSRSEEAGNG